MQLSCEVNVPSLWGRELQNCTEVVFFFVFFFCSLPCSDFGYLRAENSSECVEQEELKGRPLEFCLNGTTEQLQTSGLGSMFSSFYLPQLQFWETRRLKLYTLITGRDDKAEFCRPDSSAPSSPLMVWIMRMVSQCFVLLLLSFP